MSTTESPADGVEKRTRIRRRMDMQQLAVMGGVIALLVTWGVAWGTASAAVARKLDRDEFAQYVAAAERRFQADSIERSYQANAWKRIEVKLDSTNERLSRLICEKGPSYCR